MADISTVERVHRQPFENEQDDLGDPRSTKNRRVFLSLTRGHASTLLRYVTLLIGSLQYQPSPWENASSPASFCRNSRDEKVYCVFLPSPACPNSTSGSPWSAGACLPTKMGSSGGWRTGLPRTAWPARGSAWGVARLGHSTKITKARYQPHLRRACRLVRQVQAAGVGKWLRIPLWQADCAFCPKNARINYRRCLTLHDETLQPVWHWPGIMWGQSLES